MPLPSTHSTHQHGAKAKRGCLVVFIGWLVALGVFAWSASAAKPKDDNVVGTIALIFAIMVAPALGILYGIDLLPYLNWRKDRGSNPFWRGLILVGCWLSAAAILLVVIGAVAMAMDTDWHHLDARMVTATILGAAVCLLCLRLVWGLLKMPFSRDSYSTEAAEEKTLAEFQHYMEHPDFASLEAELGHPLPAAYKAMFAPDSEWLTKQWMLFPLGLDNDEILYSLLELDPPRLDALHDHPAPLGRLLSFAVEEQGVYLMGTENDDPPIYLESYSDCGKGPLAVEEICPRLSEFLAWPKEEC